MATDLPAGRAPADVPPRPVDPGNPGEPAEPGHRVHPGYRRGEAGFRRVSVALFVAGLAAFALLYAEQALLPALSDQFDVSPASAGLTVSLGTGALALAVIPISSLSERWGRIRVMTASVVTAAGLGLALAASPSFPLLLGLRALQGVALAGLPATALAYLAEQVHPDSLGQAVGLYVAGNSVGGLSGRLLAGLLTGLVGWRTALAVLGAGGLGCVLVYRVALPRAAAGTRRPTTGPAGEPARLRDLVGGLRRHLADPALRRLYLLGLLLSGQFVTVYNYLSYRLLAAPFELPRPLVGSIFVVYLVGTAAAATGGRLADRVGRRPVLLGGIAVAVAGSALTVPDLLPLVAVGLVALTAGFFGAHSIASGWVSRRARTARAQAAALYLCAYYAGSSLLGWLGGFCFAAAGWVGVAGFTLALLAASLLTALRLPARARPGLATG